MKIELNLIFKSAFFYNFFRDLVWFGISIDVFIKNVLVKILSKVEFLKR